MPYLTPLKYAPGETLNGVREFVVSRAFSYYWRSRCWRQWRQRRQRAKYRHVSASRVRARKRMRVCVQSPPPASVSVSGVAPVRGESCQWSQDVGREVRAYIDPIVDRRRRHRYHRVSVLLFRSINRLFLPLTRPKRIEPAEKRFFPSLLISLETQSSKMSKNLYLPSYALSQRAHVRSMEQYREMHEKSLKSPELFWSEIASQFHWETPYDVDNFYSYNFDASRGPVKVKWMEGATTNVCYNLLDKNVRNGMGDKVAFYW